MHICHPFCALSGGSIAVNRILVAKYKHNSRVRIDRSDLMCINDCCTSLIMSPSALVRNVPYTVTSRGGPVEEDSDEHEGTSARRGIGAGEEQNASVGRWGQGNWSELTATEQSPVARSRASSSHTPHRPL